MKHDKKSITGPKVTWESLEGQYRAFCEDTRQLLIGQNQASWGVRSFTYNKDSHEPS